ncbi:MAG: hypothetical protein JXA96_08475 [Sedimentisphaerales bacterium]|nr:hypothetical protein [Sedimentisphaerales bacterium]
MKNLVLILLLCSALCLVASPVKANIYNYDYSLAADNTLTTSNSWAIVDTFDSEPPTGWTYTGNGTIREGSKEGRYAAPYNDLIMPEADITKYFAVPEDIADGATVDDLTADVSFGGNEYNYLGLFWGSGDLYNSIEFYNGEMLVASYTGNQIFDPANGDQLSSSTNKYVNFYLTQNFNMVRFISEGYAFEFDNLAVGTTYNTPVPGAVLLGLIGLGFAGRKLRKYA